MGQKGDERGGFKPAIVRGLQQKIRHLSGNNVGILQLFVEPGNGLDGLSGLLPVSQTSVQHGLSEHL